MKLSLTKIQISIAIIVIIAFGLWFWNPSTSSLVYYYSPNCPHCVKFMPTWETINTKKTKINCDIQACSGVDALPTLMLNGEEYTGDRTKTAIEAWVKQNS